MSGRSTLPTRILSLLFAAVFLTAAEGQALGLRHCALHDAVPEAGSDPDSEHPSPHEHAGNRSGAGEGDTAERPGHGFDASEGEHDHGLAGCIDDCHIGSTAADSDPRASADAAHSAPSSGGVDGSHAVQGPRHLPFELHLPNAPPSSA